jgi:hypothetical protein
MDKLSVTGTGIANSNNEHVCGQMKVLIRFDLTNSIESFPFNLLAGL